MSLSRKVLSVFVFLALFAISATSQIQTAELHVTVKDAHGAVVRDATVTVTDQARGLTRSTTANTDNASEREWCPIMISRPPKIEIQRNMFPF